MRLVAIGGILDSDFNQGMWVNVGNALREYYPALTVSAQRTWYWPWQFAEMRRLIDHIVATYDTGEDLILAGHSLGGVLMCAAAPRFKKSRVVGVVTLFAPHTYLFGIFSKMLGCTPLTVPVVSFKAWFDLMSPWGTRHAQSVRHTRLLTDHQFGLVKNKKLAATIAQIVAEELKVRRG